MGAGGADVVHLPRPRLIAVCAGSQRTDRADVNTPVSYTHLDVYKRQASGLNFIILAQQILCGCTRHEDEILCGAHEIELAITSICSQLAHAARMRRRYNEEGPPGHSRPNEAIFFKMKLAMRPRELGCIGVFRGSENMFAIPKLLGKS